MTQIPKSKPSAQEIRQTNNNNIYIVVLNLSTCLLLA